MKNDADFWFLTPIRFDLQMSLTSKKSCIKENCREIDEITRSLVNPTHHRVDKRCLKRYEIFKPLVRNYVFPFLILS